MDSRLPVRLHVLAAAARESLRTTGRRRPPQAVRRALVVHHPQMLGDTLLLTPLLAKLRVRFPQADIFLVASPQAVPLYARRPYGVRALAYDPRRHETLRELFAHKRFDLAVVPGDNRYGWLARALAARWVVGFAGDRPLHKNWSVDRLVPYPGIPGMWGDMAADLVDGPRPDPYDPAHWPAPPFDAFERPVRPYAVLHVGASTPLKQWHARNWRELARSCASDGLDVVWSGGPGEQSLVAQVDPERHHRSYAGQLDLPQLWHLVAGARVLVCPDTGVAHLGRIVGTPTVALFGPGSAVLCGAGHFWRNSAYRAVTVADFPCRDQQKFFRRNIDWVRRCGRSVAACPTPGACMEAIGHQVVRRAVQELARS